MSEKDKSKKNLPNCTEKEVLSELEKDHPEIKTLDSKGKEILVRMARRQEFSGPIPHPSILDGYGKINSSFPERIVKMAEEEQKHRHTINNGVLRLEQRAQLCALLLSLAVSFVGYKALMLGHVYCAVIIFGATIGALLTAYLHNNK